MLKRFALFSLGSALAFAPLIVGGCLYAHFTTNAEESQQKMVDILTEQGYDEFNEQYKLEKVEEIFVDYESGGLNYEQYIEGAENIEDYDAETFMSESASAEAQESYLDAQSQYQTNLSRRLTTIGWTMGTEFLVTLPAGGVAIGAGVALGSDFEGKRQKTIWEQAMEK